MSTNYINELDILKGTFHDQLYGKKYYNLDSDKKNYVEFLWYFWHEHLFKFSSWFNSQAA